MTTNFVSNNSQSSLQTFPLKQLVFIDDRVDNYPSLATGLANGVEAIVLHRDRDGIEQITAEIQKYAAVYGSLDAIHIFSHGSPGQLQLGSTSIDSDNVQQYKSQLQQWKSALTDSSDILLYGCDVASGEKGTTFVKQLSQLTGADIAASVDLTGNAASGGDWDLELATGKIEASEVLSPAIAAYNGTLATLTVTNNADSGPGSLRNAIATAVAGDTIVFAPGLANQTITLTSGQLNIDKNLIIDGAAAANLTISGNNASRVLLTQNNTNVTLKNLIIANGKLSNDPTNEATSAGAGILTGSTSTLTVENCKFRNNIAGFGGGIYAGFRSTNTVINSTFDGNDGSLAINTERGGGAIGVKSGSTLSVTGSTFTNNKGTNGAAINSLLSTLTVDNSTFLNNDTTAGATTTPTFGYGGAIYTDGANASGPGATPGPVGGMITVRNSLFDGNKAAGQGGGLFLFVYNPDKIIVDNNTIINNQVILKANGDALGGGLRIGNGEVTINNTTFANNSALSQVGSPAAQGGGLWAGENSTIALTNSTFSGNKAQRPDGTGGLGGAITFVNGTNTNNLVNTTIANNYAGGFGGAFWGGGLNVTLKNTIVANNTAGNPFNKNQHTGTQFTDAGGNIQWPPKNPSDATDINVTASVAIADPLLGALQDNGGGILTHALLPGSPAIDSGTSTGAPTTDQRGITRPIDGDNNGSALVDSGAYEFMTATPEIEVLDNTTNIADNTTTALNFGTTTVGSPVSKTFTIRNTGSAALNLSNLQLPTGFTAVGTLPTTVAAGAQATLAVNLNSPTAGNFNGQLSLTTNDSDENPFNFSISGIVNTPTTPPTPPDPSCLCDQFPTPNISIGNPTPNPVSTTLNGTNANDTIAGSDASEAIFGNAGNDILTGMGGNDNIDGGAGNDLLYGNVGNDYIIGGLGNNTLFGGQDNDVLLGGAERDIIAGDFGNDTIFGGDGGDEIYGNVGTDLIDGGTGNDTIFGGQDNDAINGGTGNDIVAGDIGDDTITGSDGNDELYGNTGDDFIGGGTGEDTIFGGQDNDILKGGAGNDIVAGDIGNDTICGGDGNDQLYGNTENDLIDGCEGDDSLFGGQNDDTLIGNSDNDNLNGDLGNDQLYGNTGADTLNGGDGNDTLFGGLDNDILTGGIGDDWLSGDFGNDTLTGGVGSDRFVLSANRGGDVITDFEDGIDLLGLAGGLTFAQLSITQGAIATDIKITSTGELLASLNGVQATLIAANDFTVI